MNLIYFTILIIYVYVTLSDNERMSYLEIDLITAKKFGNH